MRIQTGTLESNGKIMVGDIDNIRINTSYVVTACSINGSRCEEEAVEMIKYIW